MRPFRWLFWGLLFDIVDFHINRFDLLPDIVGLIAIAVGLNVLRRRNPRFGVAFAIDVVSMIAWLVGVIAPRLVLSTLISLGPAALLFALLTFALEIVMVYEICAGTGELAVTHGNADLATVAMQCWRVYLGAMIAAFFFLLSAAVAQQGAGIFVLLLFVVFIVSAVAILGLMLKADRYFAMAA